MIKLHLNVGDKVRNIRGDSKYKGFIGFVESEVKGFKGDRWIIKYSDGGYGSYHKALAHHSLEKVVSHQEAKIDTVAGKCCGQIKAKTVLRKDRRNLITGKTQDEMVRELGHARGVQQFNTRCLGVSTGQALIKIGEAMLNPNKPVGLWDVDHSLNNPSVPRGRINDWFVDLVQVLIEKNNLKGFTSNQVKGTLTYNPIVTEEVYVESSL